MDEATTPPRRRARHLNAGLIALGSSAILAIYAAGYARTGPAADQLAREQAPGLPASSGPTPTAIAPAARPFQPTLPPSSPTAGPTVAVQARLSPPTATVAELPPLPEIFQDGTYVGVGTSRHGGVQVTITITRGHIVSAAITACQTRYPCSLIDRLPAQVIARQRPTVDVVSGATDSTEAYRGAVADALRQAR